MGGGRDADLKDRGGSEEDPNPKSRRLWAFTKELGSARELDFVEDFWGFLDFLDIRKCKRVERFGLVGQNKAITEVR